MSASIVPPERAWADVDLTALAVNARTVATVSGARLLPMVKADGYGVGAIPVARALDALDPWGFGVATVEEGITLRAAGIRRPIVVFTPLEPSAIDRFLAHALRPVVGDVTALQAWLARGGGPYHLEVDTGMGRSGIRWDDADAWLLVIESNTGQAWEGVFTHFHSAEDADSTERQWSRFEQVVSRLPHRPPLVHAANSAASLQGSRYAADLVRPGIFLYGGAVSGHVPQPVVRLRTRVLGSRGLKAGDSVSYDATWIAGSPITVATLGIGYADGVPRSLSNRGEVEIAGQRTPIVGSVTMDMTMVATATPVRSGEVATVFGDSITLDEQAEAAGTISYELLTGLGNRVRRYYRNES